MNNSTETIKKDLFKFSSIFYICCRWWSVCQFRDLKNGLLSDYVKIDSYELIDHMKCLASLIMNEQQIANWFENDAIELLESPYFLMNFSKKLLMKLR